MTIAVMQPYLFPYIGYFQLIAAVDKFILLDDVNFINRGWINRNNILVNSKSHLFTIPLCDASQNKLICEIEVLQEIKWKGKLYQTIEANYRKAPFFEEIFIIIKKIIDSEHQYISKLVEYSLQEIKKYLNITTELFSSSQGYSNQHLRADERIVDICRQEKASSYINMIGGVNLYSKTTFAKCGINLSFLKPAPVFYQQFKNEFVPWLSIIDVLMFNSPAQIKEHLCAYILL